MPPDRRAGYAATGALLLALGAATVGSSAGTDFPLGLLTTAKAGSAVPPSGAPTADDRAAEAAASRHFARPSVSPYAMPRPARRATVRPPAVPAACLRYQGNQRVACLLLPSFGFPLSQMGPLVNLWNGESGWRANARNPSSGAYGIPQALPATKLAGAGRDWRTNAATQIRWGLGYIKQAYGTPANAWAQWQARSPHWY